MLLRELRAILILNFFLLILGRGYIVYADSIDDLETVLVDLKSKAQQIGEDNKNFLLENKSLKRRFELFEEELNGLKAENEQFTEEIRRLDDSRNGRINAITSEKNKLTEFEQTLNELKEQEAELKQKVNEKQNTRGDLESQIQSLQKEVHHLEGDIAGQDQKKKSALETKKDYLKVLFNESQDTPKKIKKELSSLRTMASEPARKKTLLDNNQNILKARLNQVQSELQAMVDKNEQIRQELFVFKSKREGRMSSADGDIESLRLYFEDLQNFVKVNRDIRNRIVNASHEHENRLKELSVSLKTEKQLLEEKESLLRRMAGKNSQNELNEGRSGKEKLGNLQQSLQQTKSERDELQAKIFEQKKQQTSLQKKTLDLQNQIASLQKRVKDLKRPLEHLLHKDKSGFKQLIAESYRRQKTTENELSQLKNGIGVLVRQVEDLKDQQVHLKKKMDEKKSLIPEGQEEVPLEGNVERGSSKSIDRDREIQALTTHQKELEALLAQVKNQYQKNAVDMRGFNTEKEQLKDYFSMLQEENQQLKEEVSTLTEASDEHEDKP